MKVLDEYEAFQSLTDGLALARDGAAGMVQHRLDQADKWRKMAEVFEVCRQSAYQLAAEAAQKRNN
jgi:hypothetical protein